MTTDRRPAHRLRWWSACATALILLCTVMVSVELIAADNARSSTDVVDPISGADTALIRAKPWRKGVVPWSMPAPGPAESTDEPTREPI